MHDDPILVGPDGKPVTTWMEGYPREAGQWYFQRYVSQLPAPERSCSSTGPYNRAVVERVMGFCADEHKEFMRQTPEFERILTRSGILLW
jgi:polyphosphate kinase 2 (PPK2 family)